MPATFKENSHLTSAAWNARQCLLHLSKVGAIALRVSIHHERSAIEVDIPVAGRETEDFENNGQKYQRTEIIGCQVFWRIE